MESAKKFDGRIIEIRVQPNSGRGNGKRDGKVVKRGFEIGSDGEGLKRYMVDLCSNHITSLR